jgi:D-alanyl-D-alanine carboxypeptidase/D-alanyl-D-alanine-endopeptidase (penicillin-binding protein 4)
VLLGGAIWAAAATGQTAPSAPPSQSRPEPPATPADGTAPSVADVPGGTIAALATQIQATVSAPAVSRAHWGAMVTAMDGTPLAALHEGELFQPASNTKLYTTAAAFALLGANRTFVTRVNYSNPDAHGVVAGDLVLQGSGDADLNSVNFPYAQQQSAAEAEAGQTSSPDAAPQPVPPDPLRYLGEFADRVAAAGVKEIRGGVVGDDTVFPWEPYPQDWAIDDMTWGYGAPVSGLSIADNEMKATVTPGEAEGAPGVVRLDEQTPLLSLAASVITGPANASPSVQFERGVDSRSVRVFGMIPAAHAPITTEIAIPDPADYAAMVLRQMLTDRGVRVDGAASARHRVVEDAQSFRAESRVPVALEPPLASAPESECSEGCPTVLEHTSPTVAEDIVYTNKVSQNLHAELLLRQLGMQYGSEGSSVQGARVVRQFLLNAGLNADDFVFYDGSGLSGHDLVTPRATAKLLAYAGAQPWFAQWKASLPVGGVDGSLAGRFRNTPLQGHVFAKTGSLGEARALSGYLECASGRTVIFSIMAGSFVPGTPDVNGTIDRIVALVAASL